jgi:hypothetical protein
MAGNAVIKISGSVLLWCEVLFHHLLTVWSWTNYISTFSLNILWSYRYNMVWWALNILSYIADFLVFATSPWQPLILSIALVENFDSHWLYSTSNTPYPPCFFAPGMSPNLGSPFSNMQVQPGSGKKITIDHLELGARRHVPQPPVVQKSNSGSHSTHFLEVLIWSRHDFENQLLASASRIHLIVLLPFLRIISPNNSLFPNPSSVLRKIKLAI